MMNPAASTPRDAPGGVHLFRSHFMGATALMLITFILGAYHMVPGVIGTFHDDGIYVGTGWSIAHDRGYLHSSLPQELSQTKYPPVLPLIFSLIWRLQPDFPGNSPLFQGTCLIAFSLSIGMSFLYLVRYRYSTSEGAFSGILLASTSSVLLFYAGLPMAEGPFALALIAVLWTMDEARRSPGGARVQPFLAGVFLAIAILIKTLGIALIPVAVIIFASARPKKLLPFLVGLLPPVVVWFLWSSLRNAGEAAGVLSYYIDYRQDWIDVSVSEMPRMVWLNAVMLFESIGFTLAPGAAFALLQITPRVEYLFLVFGLLALWRLSASVTRIRPLGWSLLLYCAACLLHPWPPGRFLVPVAPLLAGVLFNAAPDAHEPIVILRMRLSQLFCAVAVGLNILLVVMNAQRQHEHGYPALPFVHPLPHWQVYAESFDWIRRNTTGDDVVAAGLDSMLWLYTGRRSYRPFAVRPYRMYYTAEDPSGCDLDELARHLKEGKASYLLDAPLPGFQIERGIRRCITSLAGQEDSPLLPVFTRREQDAVIYRVDFRAPSARSAP